MREVYLQSATYEHPAILPSTSLQRELRRIQSLSGFHTHYDTPFVKFCIPEDFLMPLTPSDQDYILELGDRDKDVAVLMDDNAIYVVGRNPEIIFRTKLVATSVGVRLKEVFGSFREIGSDIYAIS